MQQRCPQCDEPWSAGVETCQRCGYAGGDSTSRIPLVNPAAPTAGAGNAAPIADADEVRAGTAMLLVREGPAAGSRFLLDRDATSVGRAEDSDILFDDVTVSRKHARFELSGTGVRIVDLGSLNGTYVNRTPVDVAQLADGDEVQIGKFRMTVRLGGARG